MLATHPPRHHLSELLLSADAVVRSA